MRFSRPHGVIQNHARYSGRVRERGYIVLSMALIALLGATAMAVPLLTSATAGLQTSGSAPVSQSAARSAANHAVWRLTNDAALFGQLSGDPATTNYSFDITGAPTNVQISASSSVSSSTALAASITTSPIAVAPNAPTVVTFTMTFTNNDDQDQEIWRVEADPHSNFAPAYVLDSTSGLTDDDPIYVGSEYQWLLWPRVTVPAYGGEAIIQWDMIVDDDAGSYRVDGSFGISGVGELDAMSDANVRITGIGDLYIQTTVTPRLAAPGESAIFDYEVTVSSTGGTYEIEWIRHFLSRDFDHVDGSTTGATTADPQRSSDGANDRYQWTWDLADEEVSPGSPVVLRFQMQGTPTSGKYYSFSSVLVNGDESANGQEFSMATGPVAPISAGHTFTITAGDPGQTVTAEVLLAGGGVDVISWSE